MSQPTVAPYGSWTSPITIEDLTGSGLTLREVRPAESGIYWLEERPADAGRGVICHLPWDAAPGTQPTDRTAAPFDVRTRAHEYGGGAWALHGDTLIFANKEDQRLYRHAPGEEPVAITPEPAIPGGDRYADMTAVDVEGALHVIAVRERHRDGDEPLNELVVVRGDGAGEPRVIVSGHDFVSSPRVSPGGARLAWLSWEHPQMPWDGTELWQANLSDALEVSGAHVIAGSATESVYQPEWSPDGELHFVSDRTGWWNLYVRRGGEDFALAPKEAEFGEPQWVFGLSTYALLEDGSIVCKYARDGRHHLGLVTKGATGVRPLGLPFTYLNSVRALGTRVVMIGATPRDAQQVLTLDAPTKPPRTIRRSRALSLDAGYISEPVTISFPTGEDEFDPNTQTGSTTETITIETATVEEAPLVTSATAYAQYYPPTNPDFVPPEGELPPLLVMIHGGPTSATKCMLNLGVQFWTTRGFAVVDVDYRGSTGYGRAYRESLTERWGVADVEDCVNAAEYLVRQDCADPTKLLIRGGSAGGFAVLSALCFHDTFAAGASHYGVADLAALARDTHKFESRYTDGLVAPYPEGEQVYRDRSPIHHVERISCPVLILQGSEDMVVPQAQADEMVAAMDAANLPHCYILFEGEGHGFRKAGNQEAAIRAELGFYGKVLGFVPDDAERAPPIKHLLERA